MPYTSSAEEECRSSLGAVLIPSNTHGWLVGGLVVAAGRLGPVVIDQGVLACLNEVITVTVRSRLER